MPIHQVEYLLEHGADVNRGLKSSSLHYAACFGRPNIVKLLLQYGADPDLRDEDGHTPLEKAQERGDEWHRQVIEILQNPSWCNYSASTGHFSFYTQLTCIHGLGTSAWKGLYYTCCWIDSCTCTQSWYYA